MTILEQLRKELADYPNTQLVAVSKTKPVDKILDLYHAGQKDFGENRVQELCDKAQKLPSDIRWHLIGHLQTNKVKTVLPFVYLIHSVDSLKLLIEIEKQAAKLDKTIDVLLQIHIASEDTKFGLDKKELIELMEQYTHISKPYPHIRIRGLMGMATNTTDLNQRKKEFTDLRQTFQFVKDSYMIHTSDFTILSMGMSDDYPIALKCGSTMLRIGSMLFGSR